MSFKSIFFLFSLFSGFVLSGHVFSQEGKLKDTINLQELQIQGSLFQSKTSQVGGPLSLIGRKSLQSDKNIEFSGFLPQVPGLIIQEGTLTTNRITIRGIGSRTPYSTNRVKMYIDDIPVTNSQGETIISDLDLLDIRNIEVLRGPSSALYGGGLGGAISISSEPAASDSTQVLVYALAGSYGRQKVYFRPYAKIGRFFFSIGFGEEKSDGYRENSQFDKNNVNLVSGFHHKNTAVKWFLRRAEVRGNIPSSINENDFNSNPRYAAANWLAIKGFEDFNGLRTGLTLEHFYNSSFSSKSILFGSSTDNYESRPFNIQTLQTKSIGFRQIFNYQRNAIKIRGGLEGYSEQIDWQIFQTLSGIKGSQLLNDRAALGYLNINGLADWDLSHHLKIELGSNLQFSRGYDRVVLSPRIGFGYSGLPKVLLHGSIGHGFSMPSLEESILPDGSFNHKLRPEQGWNFDIGIRTSEANSRLLVDINVYQIFLSNLIVTQRLSEEDFFSINAGKTNHRGIEFMTGFDIVPARTESDPSLSIDLTSSIGKFTFTDFEEGGNNYSDNQLPGIPAFTLISALEASNWKGLDLGFNLQTTGSQYLNDSNDREYPGFFTMNLNAGYRILFGNSTLRIFAGIRNLSNEMYASMILVNAPTFGSSLPRYYYPAAGRNYFIGMRLIL